MRKQIDLPPPSMSPYEQAAANPALSQEWPDTPLSDLQRFNLSANRATFKKIRPDDLQTAEAAASKLVGSVLDQLEMPALPGIHLEIGPGVHSGPDEPLAKYSAMFIYADGERFGSYKDDAPYIGVDGGTSERVNGRAYDDMWMEAVNRKW